QSLAIAREDRPRLLIAGVAGMGLSQMLYVIGLARTSVTHSAVILTMSPLIAVLFSAVVFRHLPDRRSLLGLIGGFAGVSLLVVSGGSGGDATLLGDVLTFAGAAAWVVATTVPAPLVPKYGATRVTTWLLFGVIIVTLPIGAMEIGDTLRTPPPLAAWLSLLYNTVFGMILATILWQKAVHVGGSARTLVYLYLEPIGSIALAALFLGERLDAIQAIGAAIALAGMMLVRKR
ncbi:MAG: DMT family transporter, partial [Thermomicrobiales bacterium]